jgi:hypothetical protein
VTNPFQSPTALPAEPSTITRVAGPTILSAVLLLACGVLQLLQNGQVFTNGLICLSLLVVSSIPWMLLTRGPAKRVAFAVMALHVLMLVSVAASLPSKRAFEQRFNAKMEEIRNRRLR